MASSFLKKLDQFPPVLCRMLAGRYDPETADNWPTPLTDDEIATISGLPVDIVKTVSLYTTWDPVSVGTMRAFIKGCRLDLGNWSAMNRIRRRVRRGRFGYLRRSPLWPTRFQQLVAIWEASHAR